MEAVLCLTLWFLVLQPWNCMADDAIDPCSDGAYRWLPTASYRGGACPYNSSNEICDAALITSWYRAVGNNGENLKMQETEADLFRCGTKFPLWMDGNHPSTIESIVNRTLLQAYTTKTTSAQVKNCNDVFFVYYLSPTGACPEAYCFGETDSDPCPNFEYPNGVSQSSTAVDKMPDATANTKTPGNAGMGGISTTSTFTTKDLNLSHLQPSLPSEEEKLVKESKMGWWVAIGVIVTVVLIAVAVIIYVIIRKCKTKHKTQTATIPTLSRQSTGWNWRAPNDIWIVVKPPLPEEAPPSYQESCGILNNAKSSLAPTDVAWNRKFSVH